MTEKLRDYYVEHRTVFGENFRLVLESFNMEAIHKMRTSTKRLRALFILMEYLSGKQFRARKQLKRIRVLFMYSGRIREIQIEEQLVTDLKPLLDLQFPEYLEYLRRREHREIARFLKNLPAYGERDSILDDEKITAAIRELEQAGLEKRAATYLDDKVARIKALIAQPPSNKRIHTNRTHLKQLYYLYDILTDLAGTETILGLTNERIRDIEQFFGEWHDLVNSRVYMDAFLRTGNYRGDKRFKLLRQKISEKRKMMRQEIIQVIYPEIMA